MAEKISSNKQETFIFEFNDFKSRFEDILGKSPIFSKKLLNKVLDYLRPFSIMDDKKFNHVASGALFAPSWYIYCNDPFKLEMATRITTLFFVFDDHTECDWGDGGRDVENVNVLWAQMNSAYDKLLGKPVTGYDWKPYIWSFYATAEVILSDYNNAQKNRFVRTWKSYANGNINEAKYYSNYNWKSYEEILKFRVESIGVQPAVQLIEYMADIKLTDNEWDNKYNTEMILKGSEWLVMVNDLTSFGRELKECGNDFQKMHNIIAVFVILGKMDLQSAVNKTIELVAKCEEEIFDIQEKYLAEMEDKEKIKIYIKGFNHFIAGSWLCQHGIERYTGMPSEHAFRMEGKMEFTSEGARNIDQTTKLSYSKFLTYD